ncbi:hypothetical protein [Rhodoplanes sp. SY1]|uniref:hypothetical protein n=1 Tax=Rhodoplanes sp. SY1 TaxID=3166646 RepID=UPI0038B4C3BD
MSDDIADLGGGKFGRRAVTSPAEDQDPIFDHANGKKTSVSANSGAAGRWKSAKIFLETYVHAENAGRLVADRFNSQRYANL